MEIDSFLVRMGYTRNVVARRNVGNIPFCNPFYQPNNQTDFIILLSGQSKMN